MKLHLTHEMRKVPFVENGQEVCVCVSGYHEYAGVSRDQKRASEPLELMVVSHLMLVLRTEPGSSTRTARLCQNSFFLNTG